MRAMMSDPFPAHKALVASDDDELTVGDFGPSVKRCKMRDPRVIGLSLIEGASIFDFGIAIEGGRD
jgi:hypothetical protein